MSIESHLIVAAGGFAIGCTLVFVLLNPRRRRAEARAAASATAEQAALRKAEKMAAEAKVAIQQAQVQETEFRNRRVAIENYANENRVLKRDLLNVGTSLRKVQLDEASRLEQQAATEARSCALAERYLADTEKWVAANVTANNYAACKQRLTKTIEWCREVGYEVGPRKEAELLERLKKDFESEVRAGIQREEQARIKARLREELAIERELQRAVEQAAREKAAIEAALQKAMAAAGEAHGAEIEALKQRLAEAEAANQRALSQAQVTRAGHIYVISNIGAFGEGVFKIGMTRRLDPLDRVAELSDASVPFPFDVHMMISCDDAPALENAIHKEFHLRRVNRVNPKKEFFRVEIDAIQKFVTAKHGAVEYVAEPEALEYRQGLGMSVADQEYIEQVFDSAEKAQPGSSVED
jgi:hypothetical protein